MSGGSLLYTGHVMHKRLRPRGHLLRYRCYWMLLDLDELPDLDRRLRLFGYNRLAPVSFHNRDHGNGSTSHLRGYAEAKLAEAGIGLDGGPVRLLCMPRVAGYVFNPLSIYFCHGPVDELRAIIWEVSNTYGERHSYLIAVADRSRPVVTQRCAKRFYVSPFLDQDLTYEFRIAGPGEDISVVIRTCDAQGPVLLATLTGASRELTDSNLTSLLILQPFLTLKVFAAIHWEALKLWIKGMGLRRKPPPPPLPVTIVRPDNDTPADERAAAPPTPTEFQTT